MSVPELPDTTLRTRPPPEWRLRAVERSPSVARTKALSVAQAEKVVAAASRLIGGGQPNFTTQELVREARMSLQTFYKLFASKDEVLLAVFENMISDFCLTREQLADAVPDPLGRLQVFVVGAVQELQRSGRDSWSRFFTTEHWRLQQLYPVELGHATQHFADLLLVEIRAGVAAGQLRPQNQERAAWLINQLVVAAGQSLAFQPEDPATADMSHDVWEFVLAALGGAPPAPVQR